MSTSVADVPLVPSVLPSTSITVPDNVAVRLTASRTSFAMMAGGGVDIRLTKHFTYRLFDTDYYLTRPVSFISGGNVNKNNFRVTTGVALTWGEAISFNIRLPQSDSLIVSALSLEQCRVRLKRRTRFFLSTQAPRNGFILGMASRAGDHSHVENARPKVSSYSADLSFLRRSITGLLSPARS